MSPATLGIAAVALLAGAWLGFALRRSGAGFVLGGALGLPVLALAVYAMLGTPALPDLPLAGRDDPAVRMARAAGERERQRLDAEVEQARIRQLTAQLATRLQNEPHNLEGWIMLTRAYRLTRNWGKAGEAWRRVLTLKGAGATAEDWVHLAELHISAVDGAVDHIAADAIAKALVLDALLPKARHFAALRLAQSGDIAGAAAAWRNLLADVPPEADWRQGIEGHLAQAEAILAESGRRPEHGSLADDVTAARERPVEDRQAMIEGMVQRLAHRLRQQPDDPAGWLRLARAYDVLGRWDEALAALEKAEAGAEARVATGGANNTEMRAVAERARAMRERL